MLRRIVLATALSLPMLAMAQQPAQQAAQQRPAAADIDPTSLVRNALQVIAAIDQNQLGSLYDGASTAARSVVNRNDFINGVGNERRALGAAASRNWWSVTRQVIPAGSDAPAGNYMSVRFASQFANNVTAAELVSFRLDEDGVWRLAGYAIQR